jgi:hypothetical protein
VTTLIQVEPVATTTFEVVGGNTTTLEVSGQTVPATELNSEAQPATQTEVQTQPVSSTAVKYYFVNVFNQQPTRLQTKGFGESQPLAPNNPDGSDNPAGREKDRRVEFIIKTQTRTVVRSPGADPFRDAVNSAPNAAVLVQNAKTAAD